MNPSAEYIILNQFTRGGLVRWHQDDVLELLHGEHIAELIHCDIAFIQQQYKSGLLIMELTFRGRWLIFLKLKDLLI